ncbi:MAG: substrate-binding domain-containing protein [Prevotella sp.]|nr:substrate-binding domain-containing protein [Prevotella sp.]
MRKTLFYLFLLATVMVGCSEREKTYKIAVSQCSQGPWREKANQEMLAAQHLYEQDVKVSIVESYDNTQLQKRQIDSLANCDIDLLVVAPNQAEPLVDAIAKVRAKGIPVIFFDRKADTEDYTAFIGGDNVGAGRAMGNYAVSLAKKGGESCRVLEVTATMTTSPAQERHQGFESVMKMHPELAYTCIMSDWSTEAAYKVVKQQLSQGKQPDIIFCHSDFMANGAYKAVKEAKLRDKVKILGIDGRLDEGIAYVQKGMEDASYVYPTHGEKIVRLALDILTGHPYERDNLLPSMIVTPENANLEALNSKELMQQNHDLITIHDKLENYFGLYNTQHKMLIGSLITIALLIVAILMIWRAYVQTRKAIKQRQNLNVEETLFYINADSRKLRQVFETPQAELPAPRSQDTIFAETLNEAIIKHMGNPNLKMEELGEEIGLSRVQLYRKVKAITGQSPVELLRQMRLQRGYVLLTTTTKTVNEIAYEVGFGTPGYFSKCFKQQYGKYPMEVRAES